MRLILLLGWTGLHRGMYLFLPLLLRLLSLLRWLLPLLLGLLTAARLRHPAAAVGAVRLWDVTIIHGVHLLSPLCQDSGG